MVGLPDPIMSLGMIVAAALLTVLMVGLPDTIMSLGMIVEAAPAHELPLTLVTLERALPRMAPDQLQN